MIYDQVEQAFAIANANFATDMAALVAAKSIVGLTTTATFIKRQDAEIAKALNATPPFVGVVALRAATQAKDQGKRDTLGQLAYDYYASGADPLKVAKQAELAVEALLQSVDRLAGSGSGVFGAGELSGSIEIEMTDGFEEGDNGLYFRRGTVRFPIWDRDTGL